MKESKKDLVKRLREAFYKTKHAQTADDFYYWQDIVNNVAWSLRRLEFQRSR